MKANAPVPVQKTVLLLGAGHAHFVFLRKWRMRPLPGVAVTLVNEAATIPYSAMVPAHIAGESSRDEITIDLVRFCHWAGARLIAERVVSIVAHSRSITFADRPSLSGDVLSLGLGSVPADLSPTAASFPVRPLAVLLSRLDAIDAELRSQSRPFHLTIVGGGASGCELAVAIHNRLGHHTGLRVTILQSSARLLPRFPAKTAAHFAAACQVRGIDVRLNCRVTGGEPGSLTLATGEHFPCDAVLWATPGAPPDLIARSDLATDEHGFLKVRATLQAEGADDVFGTGDCVAFAAHPDLARSGVNAVRQGAVLYDNITALLQDKSLRHYRPRDWRLYLLNRGDGVAVLNYGPLSWSGRWVRRWKNTIDRRWVESFVPPELEVDAEESPQMRCGGCGSKVSGDVLSAVLKRLEPAKESRIVIGTQPGDDAAVFRLADHGPVEVQTIDYFRSFTDDPYLFGRVAAQHAVSDLYAMNATPFAALAIATLPFARGPIQEAQLYELLAGAQRTFGEHGITLAGGHTTEGNELAVGFAVTGTADEGRLFRKGGLQAGDRIIVTKPLGTGAVLAAWMRNACRAEWYVSAVEMMLQSNRAAAEVFSRFGMRACTDVTGFGLAGHLLEMLDASGVAAKLFARRVPLLAGFRELTALGIVSSLHRDNAKVSCRVESHDPLPAWLFDPQTSGGLLVGVAAERAEDVLQALHAAGCTRSAVIGEVSASTAPRIELIAEAE